MRSHRLHITSSLVAAVTLMLALTAVPRRASAFALEGVGGKLGYESAQDLDGTAELGLHAELDQPGTRVHLLPNVTYWNVDGVRDLSPNMDAYYHFNPAGRVTPYLGGGLGLNFVHRDRGLDSTDLGMNVIGGLRFPGTQNHYFLEGRYTASDVGQVSVLTGITFGAH